MYRRLTFLGLITCCGLILTYGLAPWPSLPQGAWLQRQGDTVLHALAFGALALPMTLLTGPGPGLVMTSAAAGALELLQSIAPGREADISDLVAGVGGALFVTICVSLIGKSSRKWRHGKTPREK